LSSGRRQLWDEGVSRLARPDTPLGDLDELLRDVDRYLAAVDLFRALGHEPTCRCDELIAPSMPWP
jgi:hypothetical protein